MSPTQRMLAVFKRWGWPAKVTEHWNPYAHIRQDLFGFIDILALPPAGAGCVGVQVTTSAHVAERLHKIEESPYFKPWVRGNHLWVVGWAKRGARGERKLWTARGTALHGDVSREFDDLESLQNLLYGEFLRS